MKAKITKTLINELKPGPADFFVWDTELPRFGLKVTPAGRIVYIAQYRSKGRMRRLTLGQQGALTPDKARQLAALRLGEVAAGEDPAEGLAEERHGTTVKDLAARYLEEHAEEKKKASSAAEDKRLLEKNIVPAFGNRTVASISRADIGKLHHEGRETPYQANRILSLLRKMMNLAERWGLRPDGSNPCRHVDRYKEDKRRRFLSIEELARLGAALKAIEAEGIEAPQAIAAVRLILFTGARLSEILTLKWSYVNFEQGAIVLPDSKTGFKSLPLTAPARELLEGLPAISENDYVLPGRRKGSHIIGLQHIWQRIRTKAKLPDVRLHDLRHSYASIGAAAGLGLPIIGALLGHMDASTTQRYSHLSQDPLKVAAEMISKKIDEALKTEPAKLRIVK
jgi:integrase